MSLIIAGVFGLLVGSFLNVCAVRMPFKESIAFPASHCISCRTPIRWYDNIPLLSFLILKGHCRSCKSKISFQYPLVEFLTALLFVGVVARFGVSPTTFVFIIFSCALLLQAAIDWKHEIIPDAITLPGIVLGFIFSIIFPEIHGETSRVAAAISSALGIVLGGGILYLIGTLAEKILKKEAMGGGDVKLLAMIGAFLGWQGFFCTLFFGSLLGAFLGISLRIMKGKERIPFGPYLAMGALIYLFFGNFIIEWYWNRLNAGIYS